MAGSKIRLIQLPLFAGGILRSVPMAELSRFYRNSSRFYFLPSFEISYLIMWYWLYDK